MYELSSDLVAEVFAQRSHKNGGAGIMLSHKEEIIVRMLGEKMATPKQLADALGKGYTEFKAQSMVLTLARKGLVDKTKAALILRGTEMVKFLSMPVGSGLKGGIPAPKLK